MDQLTLPSKLECRWEKIMPEPQPRLLVLVLLVLRFRQDDHGANIKTTSPAFFVTNGQTQLLLAEAVQRGWITTGTAQGYFNAGVTAHMEQMASYDAAAAVPAASITVPFAANPYNAATALQQINTQYWIASFFKRA